MEKIARFYKQTNQLVEREKYDYNFVPETILVVLYTLAILLVALFSDVSLFGNKQTAIFDFWFLVHVLTGATVSVVLFRLRYFKLHNPIILLLLISVQWEVLEVYIEGGLLGEYLTHWFGGVEHFFNRFLGDQLAMLLGFTLIKARPYWYPYVLSVELLFVGFHIWVGDSTFLL